MTCAAESAELRSPNAFDASRWLSRLPPRAPVPQPTGTVDPWMKALLAPGESRAAAEVRSVARPATSSQSRIDPRKLHEEGLRLAAAAQAEDGDAGAGASGCCIPEVSPHCPVTVTR